MQAACVSLVARATEAAGKGIKNWPSPCSHVFLVSQIGSHIHMYITNDHPHLYLNKIPKHEAKALELRRLVVGIPRSVPIPRRNSKIEATTSDQQNAASAHLKIRAPAVKACRGLPALGRAGYHLAVPYVSLRYLTMALLSNRYTPSLGSSR